MLYTYIYLLYYSVSSVTRAVHDVFELAPNLNMIRSPFLFNKDRPGLPLFHAD